MVAKAPGTEGRKYEKKCNLILKKAGLLHNNFRNAHTNPNMPDGKFYSDSNDEDYNIEYKLSVENAEYGSVSLGYNVGTKKWMLGGAETPEAEELRDLLGKTGLLEKLNSKSGWGGKGVPNKFKKPPSQLTQEEVDEDKERFTEFTMEVGSDAIHSYYAKKNTYYIQIGDGMGFYYLESDPARLKVPQFNVNLMLRVRLKPKNNQANNKNYSFNVAIRMQKKAGLRASPYNIENSVEFLK